MIRSLALAAILLLGAAGASAQQAPQRYQGAGAYSYANRAAPPAPQPTPYERYQQYQQYELQPQPRQVLNHWESMGSADQFRAGARAYGTDRQQRYGANQTLTPPAARSAPAQPLRPGGPLAAPVTAPALPAMPGVQSLF